MKTQYILTIKPKLQITVELFYFSTNLRMNLKYLCQLLRISRCNFHFSAAASHLIGI
jgi:hypothetical protein